MNQLHWLAVLGSTIALIVVAYLIWTKKPPKELRPGVPVRLSAHAQQRMDERGVELGQIYTVLAAPDHQERDPVESSVRLDGCDDGHRFLKVWVAEPWPAAEIVVKSTAWHYYTSLTIPLDQIGRLIGRAGSTINNLQAATGTRIKVANDGTVHISGGNSTSVDAARRRIQTFTLGQRRLRDSA